MEKRNTKNPNKDLKFQILELRNAGKSVRQIQEELKCSKSTISFHCSRNNLSDIGLKKQVIDDAKKMAIKEHVKNNTITKTVTDLGISKTSIKRYMDKKTDKQYYPPANLNLTVRPEIFEFTKDNTLKAAMEKFNLSERTIVEYCYKKGKGELTMDTIIKIIIYRQDCTIFETATKLGISSGSVKKYMRKYRESLKIK